MAQLYSLAEYKSKTLKITDDYFDLTDLAKLFDSNLKLKISKSLLIALMNTVGEDNSFIEILFESHRATFIKSFLTVTESTSLSFVPLLSLVLIITVI